MKVLFTTMLAAATMVTTVSAQKASIDGLQISGYVQVQNQWGQEDAVLKVGTPNSTPGESFNRFGIRRGRIKLAYETGIATAVFQFDATEKGVGIKDAYLKIEDPWAGVASVTGGVFNRPFGYEIGYSSSSRESPERSTIFQTLFPDERDLGAMLTLQAPASSPLNFLKLDAGLFAGNGIKQENDNKRDFIGHLSAHKRWGTVSLAGGVSYYNGEALLTGGEEAGGYAKREYFGLDAQLSFTSSIGLTKLNAEYLTGTQPGMGDFNGGYAMLVQYLGRLPVAMTGKWDWFAPADVAHRETLGVGALWNLTPAVRMTAWYDIARNEGDDLADNIFTLRLQYKF